MAKSNEYRVWEEFLQYWHDPFAYVMANWEWGKKGSPLEGFDGPDKWQRDVLVDLGRYYLAVAKDPSLPPYQLAIATGHGPGKTALLMWINKHFMATRRHPQVIVTANTMEQLTKKTWRELAKWNKIALDGHLFEWTATSFYFKPHPETWFANAIPWSKNNSEAFAGAHDENVLLLTDEGSNVDDIIWEVQDGAMTTPGAIRIVAGNPTRTSGRFYDCFHKYKQYWKQVNVNSLDAKMTNKAYLKQLIEMYGEDNDRTKVRVYGQFPAAGFRQLISAEAVAKCMKVELEPEAWVTQPLIAGLDVARFGECETVLQLRQGRKFFDPIIIPTGDLMVTAAHVAAIIKERHPMVTIVDEIGIGAGVLDRLRQLGHNCIGGNSGHTSDDPRYLNKRAQAYFKLKDVIEAGCELPKHERLRSDLVGLSYDFTDKGRLRLDRKQDFIDEYGVSPDYADAAALTYYYEYAPVWANQMLEPECFPDT